MKRFSYRPLDLDPLPEIRVPRIYYRGRIHPQGLFGPHREQYGKILLPFPVPNPLFENVVEDWAAQKGWNWKAIEELDPQSPTVREIGLQLRKEGAKYRDFPLWMDAVPVLPWAYRTSSGDVPEPELRHFLNLHYARILDRIEKIYRIAEKYPQNDWRIESLLLYKAIKGLFIEGTEIRKIRIPSLFQLLVGKEGIPRRLGLAYHIDYSGRSVIVPTLEVHPEEVLLPLPMAKDLFHPLILHEARLRKSAVTPDLVREVSEGRWVVINRQPTLHRYSMMAFRVKIWPDPDTLAVGIHPSIVQPFNADFDGDTMAVWPVFSDEAVEDFEKRLALRHHVRNRATGEYQILPRQDYLYALFWLSESEPHGDPIFLDEEGALRELAFDDPGRLVRFAGRENSAGRRLIEWVTEDRLRVEAPITKKTFSRWVSQVPLSGEEYLDLIHRLHQLHPYAQMRLSLEDLLALSEGREEPNNEWLRIVVSGARASREQLDMMTKKRGLVSAWSGQIFDIQNPFYRGLYLEEYYALAYQARQSLVDKGITVSDPGYLSRRLFLAMAAIRAVEGDCGAEAIEVPRHLLPKLKGLRYEEDGDRILVRWTGACRHKPEEVCQACFGAFSEGSVPKHRELLGAEVVGYLSEPTTQMTLRVFHTGGLLGEIHHELHGLKEEVLYVAQEGSWAKLVGEGGEEYQVYVPQGYRVVPSLGETVRPGDAFLAKISSMEITNTFPELEKALELRSGYGILTPTPTLLILNEEEDHLLLRLELEGGETLSFSLPKDQPVLYPSGTKLEAFRIVVPGALNRSLLEWWYQKDPKVASFAWALSVAEIYASSKITIPLNFLGVLSRTLFRSDGLYSLKQAMTDPLDRDLFTRILSERVKSRIFDYLDGAEEHLITQIAKGFLPDPL